VGNVAEAYDGEDSVIDGRHFHTLAFFLGVGRFSLA